MKGASNQLSREKEQSKGFPKRRFQIQQFAYV